MNTGRLAGKLVLMAGAIIMLAMPAIAGGMARELQWDRAAVIEHAPKVGIDPVRMRLSIRTLSNLQAYKRCAN
jgi:hypothetical protein